MIIFFLSLLTVFLLAYGLFRTAEVVFSLPRSQMHEAIRDLPGRRKFGQKLNDRLLVPVSRFVAKGIFLSEFKQKQMQADFDRLERKDTPKDFVAVSLTRSLLLASRRISLHSSGNPFALSSDGRRCHTCLFSGYARNPNECGQGKSLHFSGASQTGRKFKLCDAGQPRSGEFF